MKKIIIMLIASIAVVALSGCSGAGTGQEHVIVDTTIHTDTTVKHDTTKKQDTTQKDETPKTETPKEETPKVVFVVVDDDAGDSASEDVSDDTYDDDIVYGFDSIDIQDLDDGYAIRGYSSYGNDVKLLFLDGRYTYQRVDANGVVTEEFNGYFDLENGAIKIYFGDDDGGGYAIETNNGFLEVGYFYDIIGVQDDITVMDIYRLD